MPTTDTGTSEPGWTPPAYAAPARFTESGLRLGPEPFPVPATLTMPDEPPLAAAVLLSGGGHFDRDETTGVNKPAKDLAWGLATRGVAVLRFDKPTFAYPEFAADPELTMAKEYVPYAAAAVAELHAHPAVPDGGVFLVGHSMGGKVAPMAAAAAGAAGAPGVAGIVTLAADAEPMHHAAVRVVRYLAEVLPDQVPPEVVAAFERQAALVEGPGLTPDTPATELPFGFPAAYWLQMRAYDPVAAAAELGVPMLILQGGRDYQVTVAGDLARWRAGLADRADVDVRVYDACNHLFFPGEGPSTPAEYVPLQHVDPAVVADIATWLAKTGHSSR